MKFQALIDIFQIVPPEVGTFFLSMLPMTETRVSLPLAMTVFHLSDLSSLFWVFVGNMMVVPIAFFWFSPLLSLAEKRWKKFHYFLDHHVRTLETKHRMGYEKYGMLLLFLITAIPLPALGMWTSSLLAVVFKMKSRRTVLYLALGQLVAMGIVFSLTKGGVALLG